MLYAVEYKKEGKLYSERIEAITWKDAYQKAKDLGLVEPRVVGIIGGVYPIKKDKPDFKNPIYETKILMN
jgi:hypothetical protein